MHPSPYDGRHQTRVMRVLVAPIPQPQVLFVLPAAGYGRVAQGA